MDIVTLALANEYTDEKVGSSNAVEVIDNLTSTSTTSALSANQGKILNDKKVDKVSGKGLSTNDYTTAEKNKLAGLVNYNDDEIRKLISDLAERVSALENPVAP